jgi:hypothetical protein
LAQGFFQPANRSLGVQNFLDRFQFIFYYNGESDFETKGGGCYKGCKGVGVIKDKELKFEEKIHMILCHRSINYRYMVEPKQTRVLVVGHTRKERI